MTDWMRLLVVAVLITISTGAAAICWELAEDARHEYGKGWFGSLVGRSMALLFAGLAFWWWHAL